MDDSKGYFRRIGDDVTIWPLAKIVGHSNIEIGNKVIIDDFCLLISGPKTIIGDFVHIGSGALITGGGEFVMEPFSGLSAGVKIFTGNEDYSGSCLTNPTVPAKYRKPLRSFVHIEKHAIIGANAVILPGVKIGEGAVVGANALVKRDCAPWTVYAGTPARSIGSRPSSTILSLEQSLRAETYDKNGVYLKSGT